MLLTCSCFPLFLATHAKPTPSEANKISYSTFLLTYGSRLPGPKQLPHPQLLLLLLLLLLPLLHFLLRLFSLTLFLIQRKVKLLREHYQHPSPQGTIKVKII
jgi:hypothetical protein